MLENEARELSAEELQFMSGFVVLIPARMSSSRLPAQGAGRYPRQAHGGARRRAGRQKPRRACGGGHPITKRFLPPAKRTDIEVVMTGEYHESGTTRLAEAAQLLGLSADTVVVNVQGDEPLIDPKLVDQTAAVLVENGAPMATAAHAKSTISMNL